MTKEQEEAINNIKVFIRSIRSDLVEESKDNQKLANDIEAVLNMLKENSAEIEQKNTELAEKSAEIEKKDKIIDLMSEWLYEDDTSFGYGKLKDINTSEKIKQYFERKVKND